MGCFCNQIAITLPFFYENIDSKFESQWWSSMTLSFPFHIYYAFRPHPLRSADISDMWIDSKLSSGNDHFGYLEFENIQFSQQSKFSFSSERNQFLESLSLLWRQAQACLIRYGMKSHMDDYITWWVFASKEVRQHDTYLITCIAYLRTLFRNTTQLEHHNFLWILFVEHELGTHLYAL